MTFMAALQWIVGVLQWAVGFWPCVRKSKHKDLRTRYAIALDQANKREAALVETKKKLTTEYSRTTDLCLKLDELDRRLNAERRECEAVKEILRKVHSKTDPVILLKPADISWPLTSGNSEGI